MSKKKEKTLLEKLLEELETFFISASTMLIANKKLTFKQKRELDTKFTKIIKEHSKSLDKPFLNQIDSMYNDMMSFNVKTIQAPNYERNFKKILENKKRYAIKEVRKSFKEQERKLIKHSRKIAERNAVDVVKNLNDTNDINKAVREVRKKCIDQGMTKSVFFKQNANDIKKGKVRRMNIDAYNRMEAKRIAKETYNNAVVEYADEQGIEIFQVSAHAGARDGCYDSQGKLFTLNGKKGSFVGIDGVTYDYKPLDDFETYRDAAGIFGINCRHVYNPVNPDYFKDLITKKIPSKAENERQQKIQAKKSAKRNRTSRNALYGKGK